MHIDWWTLALQTVNVLVLIWILAGSSFGRSMDIVAKRQEQTNKLLADAVAARQEAADALVPSADKARAEIGAERDQLIAEARKSAQMEKANLLAQSSQEIAKLHSEAEAAIARDANAAEQAIIARATRNSPWKSRSVCLNVFRRRLPCPHSSMGSVRSYTHCHPRKERASRRRPRQITPSKS